MATQLMDKPQTGTWSLDPAHTSIGFVARHLMVTKVRGEFKQFSAAVIVGDSAENSSVSAEIEVASLTSGDEKRDGHLRSADFFDVEKFPKMTFKSTSVSAVRDGKFRITGDLTIRDVTRPVELEAEYLGLVPTPWNHSRIAVSTHTTINREEWGLTWNVSLETGGVLVSKEIAIEIEAQLVPQA